MKHQDELSMIFYPAKQIKKETRKKQNDERGKTSKSESKGRCQIETESISVASPDGSRGRFCRSKADWDAVRTNGRIYPNR